MGIILFLMTGLCGLILFNQWTAKIYQVEILALKPKEYKLKRILGMGLFMVDHLPMERIFRKPNYPILQLYGRQDYTYRVRLYEAEKSSLSILIIFGTILLALLIALKGITYHRVEELERGPFGSGDQTYHYSYELNINEKITEEDTVIVAPEELPNDIQRAKALEDFMEALPSLILNGNSSLERVTEPLNLIKEYRKGNITLTWESQNDRLIRSGGEIRYNNLEKEGEKVILKALINCYGLIKEVSYEVKLYPRSLSQEEERALVTHQISSQLSLKNLRLGDGKEILLPIENKQYGAKMKWFNMKKNTSIGTILFYGILLAVFFYWLKSYELKTQVKKKEEALLREFPGCINKFALLMNAGMTFTKAWEKITMDYIKLKQLQGNQLALYEEMLVTLEDIGKGVSELRAYEAFGQRCKIPEILRFTALIVQNIKKGSHLLLGALQQQSKEAMCLRQDLARKKGEKASTKLIFPMGIMFMAILIIVMTPAIITLKL